tara:strand:- start:37034 stop:37252 length:219 start_codon:yes stop_codon:yes gene_type:complete
MGVAHMIGITHSKQTGKASFAIDRQKRLFVPNKSPEAHSMPMKIGLKTPTKTSFAFMPIQFDSDCNSMKKCM